MRRLIRLFFAIIVILFVSVVLVFMLENQQLISLSFLGWTGPQLAVSFVTLVALLIGMIIGPLIHWICASVTRTRRNRLV